MKKLLSTLVLTLTLLVSAQTLTPTIGGKYTGGVSYDMEHDYFSGQLGLIYTPEYGTVLFDNVGVSGEYIYDHLQEFTGNHNFYVLKLQFAKPVDDFISLTYYGGYMNMLSTSYFRKELKTNLTWGVGIRASDDTLMAEVLYENIAGYPHVSLGVHVFLWDILGNKN